MVELNLVHKNKSEVEYTVSNFPDTQKQIKIEIFCSPNLHNSAYDKIVNEGVVIKSRMSWDDVQLIIATVKALKGLKAKEIHLEVPYFLGARSDRKFEKGSSNYLKMVICPIINSLKLNSVTVTDPHSNCLEMGLKNFESVSNADLLRFTKNNLESSGRAYFDKLVIITPDAGAEHKIFKLLDETGFKNDVITCRKERDNDGKLTKCVVPLNNMVKSEAFLIIDDLCDGGATFINIAKALTAHYVGMQKPRLYLMVTHGIFSKGFGELQQYFDNIYTTNSYQTLNSDTEHFVKQLDIF